MSRLSPISLTRSSDGIYSVKLGRHFTAQAAGFAPCLGAIRRSFRLLQEIPALSRCQAQCGRLSIAHLEKTESKLKAVVTQNIDKLA